MPQLSAWVEPPTATLTAPLSATLATALAALAVMLLVPELPRPSTRSSRSRGARSADVTTAGGAALGSVRGGLVTGAVAAGAAVALVEGRVLVLTLIGLAAAGGVAVLVERRRSRRAARRRTDRVVEVCEALSGELRAGQPPGVALRHACEFWDELTPVVVAAELGADVPLALHRLSVLPGARGLREVAGAWQVSSDSGATLAAAVSRVAASARQHQATRRLVDSELAAARATASMLALLPVGILVMGAGVGGDPLGFLAGTTIGLVCLGAGVALTLAGLLWIERVADGATTR